MNKINKQIPVDEKNVQNIEEFISTELSENFNSKINEVISTFFNMLNYEKIGIANLLTADEAMLISDIMHPIKYSCQISPKVFLKEHIKNAYLLGNVKNEYEIDKEMFLEKITSLAESQCYLLITLACKINAKKNEDENEDYVKLIKKTFLISEYKESIE